jgi:hypothetical protein
MALSPEEQKELEALNGRSQPSSGLSAEEQAELAALNQQSAPSLSDQARGRMQQFAGKHKSDTWLQKLGGSLDRGDNPTNAGRNPFTQGVTPMAGPTAGLAKYLAGSAMGRIGAGTASGAASGASTSDDPVQGAERGAVLGGGLSALGEGVSALAQAGANSAMKRAVGITGAKSKTAPQDIGNRLVDEGIWGTKAGMADQVAGKYGQAEKEVQDLAANVPGQVSGDKLAEAVESRAGRHLMPSTGQPIVGHGPDVDAMASRAAELRGLPQGAEGPVKGYGAQDLLALKRGGDWEGFTNSGTPATSTAAEIGRTQADAARAGLSDISSGAMPAALKREQALLLADKALSTPEMTYKNPISLTDIFSGGVGTALGGAPGTAIGIAASKAARTPLAQSIFAQGAQKVAAPAADAVSKLSPQEAALLQSLFTPNESQR